MLFPTERENIQRQLFMDSNEKVKQFCLGCYYNDKGTCRYGEECAGTVHPRRCEEYVRQ